MKLEIISEFPDNYSPKRLAEEAVRMGLEVSLIGYDQLHFDINTAGIKVIGRKGASFPEMVIFRSLSGYFFPQRDAYLELLRGKRILNERSLRKWPRLEQDKFTQTVAFQKVKVPFVESQVFGNSDEMLKRVRDFPVVVKSFGGSHGRRVFEVKNQAELEEIAKAAGVSEHLIQPVLPEGEDVRVIVVGNRVIGAMKRKARSGMFVSNYSAGGRIEKYDLEKDRFAGEAAIAAAAACCLEFGGIDLMKDRGGRWRVLEVNRACQFKGFEKATGVNVAKAVISHLMTT